MSECYKRLGNLDLAMESYINYSSQKDSAKSLALQQTITELEAKYQNKEKEQLIRIQDLTIQEKEANIQAKTNQNLALIIGIIAIIILAIFLYYSYKSKKNQELSNAIIKEQEKGITAVFNAQEEERKRISKDLHDGVGQQLSGLKMGFQKVANGIKDENPQRSEEMEKLSKILSESADEVRFISHQMMPKALTELGLIDALDDMLKKSLGLAKISYEFEHFGVDGRLNEQVEISLYRVCQELINNVIKHSEASQVNVQLFKNQNKLIMMVEDNGKGFLANKENGHGLLNMKSRVSSINGEINIEPSPTKGTLATVRVSV
jgi:signal transduction histidine kinase